MAKTNFCPVYNSLVVVSNAKIEETLTDSNLSLISAVKGQVGDGLAVRFWMDTWLLE